MTYEQTLEYLFTQLPVYQRQGAAAYKPDLSKTEALMDLLGHPEQGLKCVHIAGTNGKGTTSALVEAALRAAGVRVGLDTSPHLVRFNERIRLPSGLIADDALEGLFDECVAAASSRDQRLFAAAASRYRARLAAENWIDEALLGGTVTAAVEAGTLQTPERIWLAQRGGPDRRWRKVSYGEAKRTVDAAHDGRRSRQARSACSGAVRGL